MLYSVVSTSERLFRRLTRKGSANISRAVRCAVEQLESRQLLSVALPGSALAGAILTVTGTSGDDNIVVQLVPGDSTHLQVLGAGSGTATYLTSKVKQININGGEGNDTITVNAAIRSIITDGSGNDSISGGAGGHDSITAGGGFDFVQANAAYDYVKVGNNNDTLVGSSGGHDTLIAGNGIDQIESNGAYDTLTVGGGNVTISASSTLGHVMITGGNGYDSVQLSGPYDYVKLGDGYDTLVGSPAGHDTLIAGAGIDSLTGNGAYDYLLAGNGNDTLVSGPGGHSHLQAGNGNDSLTGNGAYDYLLAGSGNDTLVSGPGGHAHLQAGNGNDSLTSNGPYDYLLAGTGMDTLAGSSAAHDTLISGSGADSLSTAGAYTYMLAGNGKDSLAGSGGHDTLLAGSGADFLQVSGGTGSWLQAGRGNDSLFGGSGDTYHYGAGSNLVSNNYGTSMMVKTLSVQRALPSPAAAKNVKMQSDYMLPGIPGSPSVVLSNSSSVGYNNIDTLEAAYSIPDPTLAGDLNGAGQTIAIVDPYGPGAGLITSDVAFFSAHPPVEESVDQGVATVPDDEIISQSGVPLFGLPVINGVETLNPSETLPAPTTSSSPSANQFTFNVVLSSVNGQIPTVDPATAADNATETDLDIEWAHAIAPNARIVLFEAASLQTSDIMFAVNQAAQFLSARGGGVVSMSFGTTEFSGESQFDSAIFGNPAYKNVSFVAASGDTGGEDSYPAMSPFVTSVGGTTLLKNYDQQLNSDDGVVPWLEYVWQDEGTATSALEPVPNAQAGTPVGQIAGTILEPPGSGDLTFIGPTREGPDVVMDADPGTGVAVYNTSPSAIPGVGLTSGWEEVGGTSLACPLFAAVVTLANQARAQTGQISDASGDTTLGAELNGAMYFLHNTEFQVPTDSAVVVLPGTDMTTTPPTPVLGNFQVRGENTTVGDISIPTPPPGAPTPEAPDTSNSDLTGAVGLFLDLGGAYSIAAGSSGGLSADPGAGVVNTPGGKLSNTLAWDSTTGLGSPNVNVLVYPNFDSNPMDDFALGETVGPGTFNGGGVIQFAPGGTPSLNLANVPINLDTLRVVTTTGGTGSTSNQVSGLNVNIPNINLVATYNSPIDVTGGSGTTGSTADGAVGVFEAHIGLTNTFALATGLTANTFGFAFEASAQPASAANAADLLVGTQAIPDPITLNQQNGTFAMMEPFTIPTGTINGVGVTDSGFIFIQGTISNAGLTINGSFYRVATNIAGAPIVDANGNPVPWASMEGRGGNLTGSFSGG